MGNLFLIRMEIDLKSSISRKLFNFLTDKSFFNSCEFNNSNLVVSKSGIVLLTLA